MLNVQGAERHEEEDVQFDPYVPISVNFFLETDLAPLYWRSTDGKTYLLEIGIRQATGLVQTVTLTMLQPHMVVRDEDHIGGVPYDVRQGLPVCDTTPWRTRSGTKSGGSLRGKVLDETAAFKLHCSDSEAVLKFEKAAPIHHYFCVARVCFGISGEDELCEIRISDLSEEERELLFSALV